MHSWIYAPAFQKTVLKNRPGKPAFPGRLGTGKISPAYERSLEDTEFTRLIPSSSFVNEES